MLGRRRKPKELTAERVFAIGPTNELLVAIETWIARKLPVAPEIPPESFRQLMADLDRIEERADEPGSDPEALFGQFAQALSEHLPASPPDPAAEAALNHHERLFRAVYWFDSETYNDGVETFFAKHDEAGYRLVLDGLEAIGDSETRGRLAALGATLFGGSYPATEVERAERLAEAEERHEAELQQFSRCYAEASRRVDELLALWARANRAHFI